MENRSDLLSLKRLEMAPFVKATVSFYHSKYAVVALFVVVFALRVYHLDSRPLWWDEGLTLTYAYLPPVANLELAVLMF